MQSSELTFLWSVLFEILSLDYYNQEKTIDWYLVCWKCLMVGNRTNVLMTSRKTTNDKDNSNKWQELRKYWSCNCLKEHILGFELYVKKKCSWKLQHDGSWMVFCHMCLLFGDDRVILVLSCPFKLPCGSCSVSRELIMLFG